MEDLGDPPTPAYWLAWATAFLLIIGVVSAGVMNIDNDGSDDGVVSAAGRTSGTLDVLSTTSLPTVAPTSTPTTRRRSTPTSTTVPNAAAAVLRAIGTTPPTTTQPPPTTSTTSASVASTTTTTIPPTTSTSTTSTTVAPRATLRIVNEHPNRVVVTVNGTDYRLAFGETREVVVAVIGADVLEARTVDACRTTANEDLKAGGSYRLSVGPGPEVCNDMPTPVLTVTSV